MDNTDEYVLLNFMARSLADVVQLELEKETPAPSALGDFTPLKTSGFVTCGGGIHKCGVHLDKPHLSPFGWHLGPLAAARHRGDRM
jgi:hypothetical protein